MATLQSPSPVPLPASAEAEAARVRALPRCAVVNFSREGDSVRWSPRVAGSPDRVLRGRELGARARARHRRSRPTAAASGAARGEGLRDESRLLHQLSSRALRLLQASQDAARAGRWDNEGVARAEKAARQRGAMNRSPTKVSETGWDDDAYANAITQVDSHVVAPLPVEEPPEESPAERNARAAAEQRALAEARRGRHAMERKRNPSPRIGKNSPKEDLDCLHLSAVGSRKSTASRGSQKNSVFARMFAKVRRKKKSSDVFDDEDLQQLKRDLRHNGKDTKRRSRKLSSRVNAGLIVASDPSRISRIGRQVPLDIASIVGQPPRRRWRLRKFWQSQEKQLVPYSARLRSDEPDLSSKTFPRRRFGFFRRKKYRREQRVEESPRKISLYDDDFVSFMIGAAAKRRTR